MIITLEIFLDFANFNDCHNHNEVDIYLYTVTFSIWYKNVFYNIIIHENKL